MMHPDEHTIDLLILNPTLLDQDIRKSAELHLLSCTGCRTIADSLRSLYRELERARSAPPALTEYQDEIMRGLTGLATVVRLSPYSPRPTIFPRHLREGISVLAAKGSGETHPARFETVATMASSAQGMLARVVLDTASNKFKVYLLSDDPAQRQSVLLTIPRLSLNLLLDEKGQREFTLPQAFPYGEWPHVGAIVRLPIGVDEVTTAELRNSGMCSRSVQGIGGGFEVVLEYLDGRLTIDTGVPAVSPPGTAVFFFSAAEPPTMVELDRGKGQVPLPLLPSAFTLRLYA